MVCDICGGNDLMPTLGSWSCNTCARRDSLKREAQRKIKDKAHKLVLKKHFSFRLEIDRKRARNLSGFELVGVDLSGADCSRFDFSHSVLSDADFSFADCSDSNFSYANLAKAKFRGATLDRANFDGANLTGATMPDGTIHD